MIELALIIICLGILVLFAAEFHNLFKKLFSIPGVKLILPLFLASIIAVKGEDFWVWSLEQIKLPISHLASGLSTAFPFQKGAFLLANVFLLMSTSVLPTQAYIVWQKKRGFRGPIRVDTTTTILWLITAILLINYSII